MRCARAASIRAGVTLLELLVSITVLALLSAITTLAMRRVEPPLANDPVRMLADSIRNTVATGRASHLELIINGKAVSVQVRPDGSVVADSVLGIEPLTGRPRAR
jgi:prepilin-type N-terminal cleavage/methylation domain-containing protein